MGNQIIGLQSTQNCARRDVPLGRLNVAAVVLLFCLGLAVYANAIRHPFVHDDIVFIQNNPHLADWHNWPRIFLEKSRWGGFTVTQPVINSYYRPFLDLFYKIEYYFFGLQSAYYHLLNILLHIINAILLYVLLNRLLKRPAIAFPVAVMFLIHPIQTEAVSCVAGISNLMFAFFTLSSLLCYVHMDSSVPDNKANYCLYGGSLIIFLIALLTKEQAVILPFLIVFYEWCWKPGGQTLGRHNFLKIGGFFGILVLYFYFRKLILGSSIAPLSNDGELLLRILQIPHVLLIDWRLLILPYDLHYYRSFDILRPLIKPIIVFILVVFQISRWIKSHPVTQQRVLLFAVGWFFITLMPVLNIVPLINEYSLIFTAEHFLYLPMVGFVLLIVLFIDESLRRLSSTGLFSSKDKVVLSFPGRKDLVLDFCNAKVSKQSFVLGLVLVGTSCLSYGFLSQEQNRYWRGEIPLFERMVKFEKKFGRGYILLARAYYFDGQFDQAIAAYTKGQTIMEGYLNVVQNPQLRNFYLGFLKEIHFDMAHCYEAKGILPEAVNQYEKAIAIDGIDPVLHNNLGTVYLRLNNPGTAQIYFEKAFKLNPTDGQIKNNLAISYAQQGKSKEARKLFEEVLASDPNSAAAQANLRQLNSSAP